MSRWPTTRGIFTPIGWPPGSDSSPSGHAVSFSSAGVREATIARIFSARCCGSG